jgi:nucleotide-binding universal stress UspA family protein
VVTQAVQESPMDARPGVVVGVDGSDTSLGAFAYGAWEAQERGLPLYLVYCYDVPPAFAALALGPDPERELVESAAQRLTDLAEQARAAYPKLEVHTTVVAGHPGACLVRASQHAALVVVGSRGLGGFKGLLLGSVGTQLTAHASAPVIVVRPDAQATAVGTSPDPLPVVVGVDGVPDSTAAIDFAFEEASARGVPVTVLYAWWMLPVSRLQPEGARMPDLSTEADLAGAEEEVRRMLAEATAGVRTDYPDVEVTLLPARVLNPVVALLEASRDAGLLVVSRHGGNALTRLIFSSVGDVAVREASCPVAIVPEMSTKDS